MANNFKSHKIIFWGTPEFAVPALKFLLKLGIIQLVITQPDRPAGRGQKIAVSPVKKYCLENNLKFLEPDNLDDKFILALQKYLPATFVVVAYGKIIPQNILDLSALPAINIHPSKLPQLRGPSPIQTAILRGFESTAVSLMQLDKKMDHGPILGQIEAKIWPNEGYLALAGRLSQLGAQILEMKLLDYLNGQLNPLSQDDSQATYCQLIKKENGKIDWHKSAREIHNQIRAYQPWPSTFAKLGDLTVKIIKAEIVDKDLAPGEILFGREIIIGTASAALKILELQPKDKKIMSATEFIRGYQKYLSLKFD
ncbi:MAG: methionyl-tRNA formyltransferase [bacterium]|nr:methionyl-tRNA formyltransferase [bacterium]